MGASSLHMRGLGSLWVLQVVMVLLFAGEPCSVEREIKRAQVTLLVRIKNKLTPEQQAKLVEIRSKSGNK
jgi:hypothetical protein